MVIGSNFFNVDGVARNGIARLFGGELPPPAPTNLAFVSPPDNLTFVTGSALPLAVSFDDPAGIATQVQFFLNGSPVGTVYAPGPYTLNLAAPLPGTNQLQAVLTDSLGRTSTATRTLNTVSSDSGSAPSATLLTDLNGRAFAAGQSVPIAISATSDQGIAEVDLYAYGVLIARLDGAGGALPLNAVAPRVPPTRRAAGGGQEDTPAVYKTTYTLPGIGKNITLVAVALDKLGRSQTTQPVTVQDVVGAVDRPLQARLVGGGRRVPVGSPVRLPVEAIDPDANGAILASASRARGAGPVRRAFDVSANVSRVEYFFNNLKIAESTQPPYMLEFTPPTVGVYVATAIATDGAGLTGVSESVTIKAVVLPTASLAVKGNGQAVVGGTKAVVFVNRAGGATSEPLTVAYQTRGKAKANVSYVPLAGSVTIPAGQSSAKIKIRPLDDPAFVGMRLLKLKLLADPNGNYTLPEGAGASAKVTIVDGN